VPIANLQGLADSLCSLGGEDLEYSEAKLRDLVTDVEDQIED
jgi:hypothetical protein